MNELYLLRKLRMRAGYHPETLPEADGNLYERDIARRP